MQPLVVPDVRWEVVLPQCLLAATMLLALALEMAGQAGRRGEWAWLTSLGGSALAFVAVVLSPPAREPAFGGMVVHDGLFAVFSSVVLVALILSLAFSSSYLERHAMANRSEFYLLMVAAGLGMLLMIAAVNLAVVFLGLELFSLALYLLCIYPPGRSTAQEAAMKYFLLSSFASAVLLFGSALLYGGVGSLSFADLAAAAPNGAGRPLIVGGMTLVVVGLAFKLAAAPFHLWAPDVYQGAPTPVTAFMSVATKAAALAALVRLLPLTLGDFSPDWAVPLGALALVTILVGNLGALGAPNVKRMLAWSSVAHAGYLLIAPVVMASPTPASARALEAMLYYLVCYAFMNVGAFAAVAWLEDREGVGMDVGALGGLASRRPALAAGLALLFLSLTGIPPAGGFFAKLFLFGAALSSGQVLLAVIGVVGSLIGAGYYLRVVVAMYMREPAGSGDFPALDGPTALALLVAVAGVLLTGLAAQPLLNWVQAAARMALG